MTEQPALTAAEVGPVEMFNVQQACLRFRTPDAGAWHAERYGQMAAQKLRAVQRDEWNARHGRRTSGTEHRAADAYNFARMAFDGWRALRGER